MVIVILIQVHALSPIISDPIWVAWLCGCLVPTEISSHVPFKSHFLSVWASDIASCPSLFFPSTHTQARYVLPSADSLLLLCFPYSVSSVLDIPFFLLPFFLEGLGYLFSCLIFSLSTHLFILACFFPPLCWPLYRFLRSIV